MNAKDKDKGSLTSNKMFSCLLSYILMQMQMALGIQKTKRVCVVCVCVCVCGGVIVFEKNSQFIFTIYVYGINKAMYGEN